MNSSLITLTTVVLLSIITCVYGAGFVSGEQLRQDDQSPCFTAFANAADIPNFICNNCLVDIQQKVKPGDRLALIQELDSKSCSPKNEVFPEKEKSGWTLYIDQDLLTLDSWTNLNDDRNYTMGIGMSFSGSKYSTGYLARARNYLDRMIGVHTQNPSPPTEYIHSSDYGITAFTPNELENPNPVQGDRPYASLIYASNAKMTAYLDNSAVKSKFVAGALGLDVAKSVQRFLHNDLDLSRQDPLGWDNQISEGGELTLLYAMEKMKLWYQRPPGDWPNIDISYSYSGNIGYYTDVAVGLDFRLGRITTPFYAHAANPLSNYNHANCFLCDGNDNYFFASYRARLVGYNALLQGQFRDSKVEFSSSEIERLLHEASMGWSYHFSKKWQLTYALNFKSKEYKGTESRDHWFGGFYFSRNFQ